MTSKESSFQVGKILLSVDTSSSRGGLCIIKNQELLGECAWEKEAPHSETLTLKFLELLEKTQIKAQEITDVLCAQGPGSFTGLRVGLNFAKTICYANKIPITLTSSLRAFVDLKTLLATPNQRHIVLINAFKNQLFVADYIFSENKITEYLQLQTIAPQGLSDLFPKNEKNYIWGDGFDFYADDIPSDFKKNAIIRNDLDYNPSIRQSELYLKYDYCLKFVKSDPLSVEPLYIKKSEAEENLYRGKLKKHTQRKL